MPVALEFINLIIRRDAIDEKWEGGWEAFVSDISPAIECYDDYIFRTGAMNPMDMGNRVDYLESKGLLSRIKDENGQTVWKDMCVYEALFGHSGTCDWLDFDFAMKSEQPAIRFLGDSSEEIITFER